LGSQRIGKHEVYGTLFNKPNPNRLTLDVRFDASNMRSRKLHTSPGIHFFFCSH